MISVEGLTVEFGGFTLFDDVSFVVNKKDRIALVGKNGAGKSTALKMITGVTFPTKGDVIVNGTEGDDDRLSSPADEAGGYTDGTRRGGTCLRAYP